MPNPLYSRHWRPHLAALGLLAGTAVWAAPRAIDVGGHELVLECRGSGRPVVVLDAGLGGRAGDWQAVQQALAPTHEVCVYDRAGYGASTPGPPPRHSARLASELRTLLARAELPPPFLLAGHSLGGLNLAVFASFFPRDVAGLVLVDPPHERLDGVLEATVLGRLDPRGLLRGLWQSGQLGELLAALEPLAGLLGVEIAYLRTIVHETEAFPLSLEDARGVDLSPDLPLTVIAHGRRVLPPGPLGDTLEAAWLAALRETACAQPHGLYLSAEASGHMVPQEQPELVADALRALLSPQRRARVAEVRARVCGDF